MNIFSLLLALGIGLGLYQVYRLAPLRHASRRLDAAVFLVLAGLVGARAGYVLFNWPYYAVHLDEILRFWQGGLAWPGAALAVLLTLPLAARASGAALPVLADNLAHLLPSLAIAAWLGCWQAGCGCAPASGSPAWWMLATPDETGLVAARFPLQPVMALLLALEFLLAQAVTRKRAHAGLLAGRFVLALAANLLLASFFTALPAPLWHGLRLSTWSAAALTAASLAVLLFVRIQVKINRAQNLAPSQEKETASRVL